MMKYLFIVAFFILPLSGYTQSTDKQLAQHYFNNGEFDKALIYYEKLYEEDNSKFHFNRYLECLTETGDVKTAEKILKKTASANRNDQEYTILLANFYEDQGETEKATSIYNDLIEDMPPSSRTIIDLYNSFKAQSKNELALKTLEKGRKILKNSYPLNFQFAEYYGSVGETEKMIEEYLGMIDYHSTYVSTVQRVMSAQIDFTEEDSEEYNLLKTALIQRTQKNPNELIYAEMLTWLFIQRKNFPAALTHIKAMDKRSSSNGKLVYEFGGICVENKDYATARRAFKYVTDLDETGFYFIRAQNALLNVSFLEVTTQRKFTEAELLEITDEYERIIARFGKTRSSFPILLELAHIKAFYANKGQEAISLLNEVMEFQTLTDMELAELKMQLADIHVLHGDIWEASLFYMQVDKDFKYEAIGHEAKFKNARIFYYDGEFEFAQSQLDILKQSTTKLIANDALKLSLLILDNYGLDSNYIAMNWFAQADLLIEQHQYKDAFVLFDSILNVYPEHSLGDEILLKKAHAKTLQGEWIEAITYLETLLEYHAKDILADDALFQLGDIYQNHLMDDEKASAYYRRILFDYKGSLYTTEARKRFLSLRGTSALEKPIDG